MLQSESAEKCGSPGGGLYQLVHLFQDAGRRIQRFLQQVSRAALLVQALTRNPGRLACAIWSSRTNPVTPASASRWSRSTTVATSQGPSRSIPATECRARQRWPRSRSRRQIAARSTGLPPTGRRRKVSRRQKTPAAARRSGQLPRRVVPERDRLESAARPRHRRSQRIDCFKSRPSGTGRSQTEATQLFLLNLVD